MDASPCQKLHLKISVGHFSCASLEAFNSWGAKPRMDNGQPMEAAILKKKLRAIRSQQNWNCYSSTEMKTS